MVSLLEATKQGDLAAVRAALERGEDIEAKDDKGYTLLIWAAYNGHKEVVSLLLEKGSDIEARVNMAILLS